MPPLAPDNRPPQQQTLDGYESPEEATFEEVKKVYSLAQWTNGHPQKAPEVLGKNNTRLSKTEARFAIWPATARHTDSQLRAIWKFCNELCHELAPYAFTALKRPYADFSWVCYPTRKRFPQRSKGITRPVSSAPVNQPVQPQIRAIEHNVNPPAGRAATLDATRPTRLQFSQSDRFARAHQLPISGPARPYQSIPPWRASRHDERRHGVFAGDNTFRASPRFGHEHIVISEARPNIQDYNQPTFVQQTRSIQPRSGDTATVAHIARSSRPFLPHSAWRSPTVYAAPGNHPYRRTRRGTVQATRKPLISTTATESAVENHHDPTHGFIHPDRIRNPEAASDETISNELPTRDADGPVADISPPCTSRQEQKSQPQSSKSPQAAQHQEAGESSQQEANKLLMTSSPIKDEPTKAKDDEIISCNHCGRIHRKSRQRCRCGKCHRVGDSARQWCEECSECHRQGKCSTKEDDEKIKKGKRKAVRQEQGMVALSEPSQLGFHPKKKPRVSHGEGTQSEPIELD